METSAPQDQTSSYAIDGETVSILRVPLVEIAFMNQDTADQAILSAMGYTDADLPQNAA